MGGYGLEYRLAIAVRKHPEWLLAQGTLRVLNPGLPAVRNYVISVIIDVVRRYDIDGLHFDDYFYQADGQRVAKRLLVAH